jgi:hypothetical protein
MSDMYIYHPGTGTCLSLDDDVYLVTTHNMSDTDVENLDAGTLSEWSASVLGLRLPAKQMSDLYYDTIAGSKNV